MKSLSWILNVILIAALAYLYFRKTPSPLPLADDCNKVCMDYSMDSAYHVIDGNLLRMMATDYQKKRRTISNIAYSGIDASSVWFGLEDLKKFIWEIENKVCKNKCADLNLGIRIYYAKYPELDSSILRRYPDLINVPDSFGNMHTVFMVPTFDLTSTPDRHIDFYLNHPFNKCTPDSIIISNDNVSWQVGVLMGRGGKNHGTLCPPVCEGSKFGN